MYGDTPHIYRGSEEMTKAIFHSDPNAAITVSVSLPGGLGVLKAGTLLADFSSECTDYGIATPYAKQQPGLVADLKCAAYLATDAAAQTTFTITMADSYKGFIKVGNHLALADDDNYGDDDAGVYAKDLGAITAIDSTTYSHIATVTVTNALTADYDVSDYAWVYPQTLTTSPYTKCSGVLFGTVDTGTGENAKGAQGVMIVGNAALIQARLTGYDAAAATDLSATSRGGILYLK